ncbi:MAG: hypothetical protein EBT07_08080 [Actinobacteria bacterium]|nr:hypothetical protein [Actinomycetota bacterium]
MPRSEVSLLDETLLRAAAAGKSGEEIERLTGIPAAQAVVHVKNLLARRDVWSDVEQRQLLVHELNVLKDSLLKNAVELQDPTSARLLLQTLQELGRRLDSQKSSLDADVLRLSEYQQGVMLRAMDAALSFAKRELKEKYPSVSVDELDVLVGEGLLRAKAELLAESVSDEFV